MGPRSKGIVVLVLGLAVGCATRAFAAGYTFSPVQIHLRSASRSAVLTLTSQDTRAYRFQLTAVVWAQDLNGAMSLTPTSDLVFFPRLFTLEPGQQRIVRIGAAVPAGAAEKTYRLILEELPPLARSDAAGGARINVLTRVALPIFLPPPRAVVRSELDSLSMHDGRVSFRVRNMGTVHLRASTLLQAFDAAGAVVVEEQTRDLYVLAGGTREYGTELGAEECARIARVVVTARHGQERLTAQVNAPPTACGA